jgi:hypothetical protein
VKRVFLARAENQTSVPSHPTSYLITLLFEVPKEAYGGDLYFREAGGLSIVRFVGLMSVRALEICQVLGLVRGVVVWGVTAYRLVQSVAAHRFRA